jgi:hypothetical protein
MKHCFQKITLPTEYISSGRIKKKEIKSKLNDLLTYYIRMVGEAEPMLSPIKMKAKGLQNFLSDAGIAIICLDEIGDSGSGLLIIDYETKKDLAFIKTNSVLINVIFDLYFTGVFAESGGPKSANNQADFKF